MKRLKGYAADSVYASYTKREREASDRMETVYNHERGLEVHTITGTGREKGSHFGRNPLRFMSNDSLRSLAKAYAREVEDIEDGDLRDDAKGSRLRLAQARLRDVERESEFRIALAETWQASEKGTHSISAFEARGGLKAVVEDGATPPSYALAVLLDYSNFRHGEPTVLEWPEEKRQLVDILDVAATRGAEQSETRKAAA